MCCCMESCGVHAVWLTNERVLARSEQLVACWKCWYYCKRWSWCKSCCARCEHPHMDSAIYLRHISGFNHYRLCCEPSATDGQNTLNILYYCCMPCCCAIQPLILRGTFGGQAIYFDASEHIEAQQAIADAIAKIQH
ncbi:unnamed protein product [Adineta steineri]|uniref:Uncharacterized protein n=1 Tax=Adineta steineri TaxID=433720 RepID=A0A814U134_9BILA|nr:unnamed protein product [Adineta steineri]CAF1472800.1 unnamed protein product [Adineta steineri]CAF3996366.1 unnamed protein product [Adineta steineri]CAF4113652.1 unnamed protein product [Adineta steineri]